MIKLTVPQAPVFKFIVVTAGDGDVLNQPKVVPVVEYDRVMSEVRSAVNAWLYSQDEVAS
jgi:hypothetical protein